jgi:hypothetical protein
LPLRPFPGGEDEPGINVKFWHFGCCLDPGAEWRKYPVECRDLQAGRVLKR